MSRAVVRYWDGTRWRKRRAKVIEQRMVWRIPQDWCPHDDGRYWARLPGRMAVVMVASPGLELEADGFFFTSDHTEEVTT
jgi:hypothetical protein